MTFNKMFNVPSFLLNKEICTFWCDVQSNSTLPRSYSEQSHPQFSLDLEVIWTDSEKRKPLLAP